jgi:hypothetical protein
MSTEPRFTDEEIQAGIVALDEYESGGSCQHDPDRVQNDDVTASEHSECVVRAVLRAAGAVPARMLPVGQAGYPAAVGTFVEGVSQLGRKKVGLVVDSRPVTTDILVASGEQYVLWTSTIASAAKPDDWPPVGRNWHRGASAVSDAGPPGA